MRIKWLWNAVVAAAVVAATSWLVFLVLTETAERRFQCPPGLQQK